MARGEVTGTHNHQNVGGLGSSANMIGGNVQGNVYIGHNGLTIVFVLVLLMAIIFYKILKNETKNISQ